MTFHDLGLSAPILTALTEQGYEKPSPIQEKAIPPALQGRDVLGCAQTGTGKTCAFAAPILQRLSERSTDQGHIRALILTPTRELAIQIGESFERYSRHLSLRYTVIFGGVSQNPQVAALKQGTDILVATPGRLMDLHNQGHISLEHLKIFVLDEADRMLDMGFIHDVKKILKWLPSQKQTMLFSATMPAEIAHLVDTLLKNPVRVAVNPVSSPVEAIEQSVYLVDRNNKTRLLSHLINTLGVQSALVFTRTKHGANKVARDLGKAGITAAAIHGNKSQTARQQALSDFKSGKLRCLVATDIAARGLDIEELSFVFNYNLPEVPETYVHRIGRTGRAGRGGKAIAFCDFSEKPLLKELEKLMGKSIPLVEDHPFPMEVFEAPKRDRNGKVINPEDAEARQAARARKEAREGAKAASRQEPKAKEAPAEPEIPAAEEGAAAKLKRRRRKKKPVQPAGEVSAAPAEVSAPVQAEPAFEEPWTPTATRPRLVRSGTLLDTGDAMPCTEFHRPNPLDSDVIMDATARLLSSRRTPTPKMERGRSQRNEEGQRRRRGSRASGQQATEPVAADQPKNAKSGAQPPKKSKPADQPRKAKSGAQSSKQNKPANQPGKGKPAPKKDGQTQRSGQPRKKPQDPSAQKREGSSAKRGRGGNRRGMPPEPQRSHPKDSTEQPSLMKPYYLDLGR